jgi:hypothetical protein
MAWPYGIIIRCIITPGTSRATALRPPTPERPGCAAGPFFSRTVNLIQSLFAGLALLACVLLMLRLALPVRRRQRFDAACRRALDALRRGPANWFRRKEMREHAQRTASEAIRRAREGHWDGNVYRPKSFRRPPKQ